MPEARKTYIDPKQINYSQAAIHSLEGPRLQIAENGSLNVLSLVRLHDGTLVAYDGNSRLLYAVRKKMPQVPAIVYPADEPIPAKATFYLKPWMVEVINKHYRENGIDRTIHRRSRPKTWGEALSWRTIINMLPISGTKEPPVIKLRVHPAAANQ